MNWIKLKDRKPGQGQDWFLKPRLLLLGLRNDVARGNDIIFAYVDRNNEIIEAATGREANLTYYTHWMDIPDVPDFNS